jgi:hypothetical protein
LNDPDWRSMTASLAVLCGCRCLLVTLWTLPRRRAADPVQRAWQRLLRAARALGVRRADMGRPARFRAPCGREKPELAALTREAARTVMPSCATATATASNCGGCNNAFSDYPRERRKKD